MDKSKEDAMMLSREQVEELGDFLCEENLSQTAEKLLAHDAAIRERVLALERSVELDRAAYAIHGTLHQQRLTHDVHKWQQKFGFCYDDLCRLQQVHQQAVKERDELKAELEAEQMHAGCERHEKLVDTLKAQLRESHDSIQSAAGVVAHLQTDLQQAVEALAGVRTERDRLRDVKWSGITDLENRVIALEAALKLIAGYAKENGCCPYGCDTPVIASNALAALHGTGGVTFDSRGLPSQYNKDAGISGGGGT